MRFTVGALILIGLLIAALVIATPFIRLNYKKRREEMELEQDRAEQAALDEEMRRLDEQLRRNREEDTP